MTTFLFIAITHFLALLSPGPDFFLIMRTATTQGRFLSYLLCFGIAIGHLIYLILVFFGLSVLSEFEWFFEIIQIFGSIYLLYLAFQLLRLSEYSSLTPLKRSHTKLKNQITPIVKIFLQGLAISVLNPKNAVFYASLITLLGSNISLNTQLFYIAWMTSIVFVWDCIIVMMFRQTSILAFFQRWMHLIQKITAFVFIIFALSLILKLWLIP